MKKIIISCIAVFFLVMVSCKKYPDTLIPENYVDAPLPAEYLTRLKIVLDSTCKALDIKGASVAVLVPNTGIWKAAYGESHTSVPINSDMIFTIGSNTKTYVAALMMKLHEKGLLNISDTIGKWIVNKPYVDGKITIKQLLNHTSGLGDFSYNPLFIEAIKADFYRIWQPEEAYPYFEPPYFTTPGSSYQYSDQNTVLAGIIIEKITQKPLKFSMRELILAPAGLNNTVYYPFESTTLTIPHSWSADYNNSGILEDLDENYGYSRIAFCSADNAAGGMLSTAEENVRFWNSLMNGKIINRNSLELMKQFGPTQSPAFQYGLCLVQTPNAYNGRTILSHNGYVPGSVNDNGYDIESGVCISVLTNQDKYLDLSPVLSALHKVTLDYAKK